MKKLNLLENCPLSGKNSFQTEDDLFVSYNNNSSKIKGVTLDSMILVEIVFNGFLQRVSEV